MAKMINLALLKSVATPQSVARYFLGSPAKERRNELWYKSPFREETAASFEVTDRGLHDFGTGEHFDVISFVQKLKRCSFKEAVSILGNIYGIAEERNEKLEKWLRDTRLENERYRLKVEQAYLALWEAVDIEAKENNECVKIFAGDFSDDTYKICLDRQCYLQGLTEYLVNDTDTFKEKESLYKQIQRGEFPRWLMMRLKNNTMYSMIMGTQERQSQECLVGSTD